MFHQILSDARDHLAAGVALFVGGLMAAIRRDTAPDRLTAGWRADVTDGASYLT